MKKTPVFIIYFYSVSVETNLANNWREMETIKRIICNKLEEWNM